MRDAPSSLLRELFDIAADLPASEREAVLRARTDDEALVQEVLALCQAGDVTPTARLYVARDAMLHSLGAPALAVGEQLGHWRIVGEIGRGGMGLVYRVERSDGHYAQTAALKFIAGTPGREQQAHFERERQTLARLNHPNIARLLDGGASDDGRPFLVMEYVDGVHIDQWCRERKLDTQGVARLFLQACDAVAFAHRQLIVHCDIKPSNLLVDANGRVVLLDFGVARLIDRVGDTSAPETSAAGFTPRYASPEQRAGASVSTATDVYGLGVVLQGLLEQAQDHASKRELTAIALRAHAENVGERYGTAEALAEDLRRALIGEPVRAMGNSRWYRARCFLRRHAMPVTLSAALVLSLAAGLATTLVALNNAEREQRRAERTAEFLGSILSAVDPNRARELDKTLLREVLDQAASKSDAELADEPVIKAQVEDLIGDTYSKLGELAKALEHLQRAHDLLPATDLRKRLALQSQMATLKDGLNRRQDALADLEAVAQAARTAFGDDDIDTLRARSALADQYARMGDWQRALPLARELQPILETKLGPEHDVALANLHGMAIALGESGDFAEAEQTYLRLIARRTASLGADHTRTLGSAGNLAVLYLQNQRYDQAQALLAELQPRALARLGERSMQSINFAALRASALRLGGKLDESEQWYRFALDQTRAVYGDGHSATLIHEHNFAQFEIAAGRPADALARMARVEPLLVKAHGPEAPIIADVYLGRGRALAALGRMDEARAALNEALARDRKRYGSDEHPRVRDDLAELRKLDGN